MYSLILLMLAAAHEQRLNQLTLQMQALSKKQAEAFWAHRERTCAIPLLNALKGPMPPNPMPLKKPEGNFFIRQVKPPAPSCDEGKK